MIVFTDLDGTLLDHETYRFEAARPALKALREADIPLIMASSKTASELAPIRAAAGYSHCPAIVENGAGLLQAGESRPNVSAGQTFFARLQEALNALPAEVRAGFQGFSAWDAQTVSAKTGLSIEAAKLAKQRDFSEPGEWSGDDETLAAFSDHILGAGLSIARGGRFLTISAGGSKAARMAEIIEATEAQGPVIALGDAPNDRAMLEAADIGVVIFNSHHPGMGEFAPKKPPRIVRTQSEGPVGWNKIVLELIAEFKPADSTEQ